VTTTHLPDGKPGQIRVNAVAPQLLDTPTNRATFPAEVMTHAVAPEAIASVIAFLVSDAAAPVSGCPPTAHREPCNLLSGGRNHGRTSQVVAPHSAPALAADMADPIESPERGPGTAGAFWRYAGV
jgi:hypothetical protein